MRTDWIKTPMCLFEYGCTPAEVLIVALLVDISNDSDDYAYFSRCRQEYIAKTLKLSRATVNRSLQSLSEKGIIGQDRTGKSSQYMIWKAKTVVK